MPLSIISVIHGYAPFPNTVAHHVLDTSLFIPKLLPLARFSSHNSHSYLLGNSLAVIIYVNYQLVIAPVYCQLSQLCVTGTQKGSVTVTLTNYASQKDGLRNTGYLPQIKLESQNPTNGQVY